MVPAGSAPVNARPGLDQESRAAVQAPYVISTISWSTAKNAHQLIAIKTRPRTGCHVDCMSITSKIFVSVLLSSVASSGLAQAGGGGSGKMQIATEHGMFVIDHPGAGEASMTGWVLAMLAGDHSTPADTIVTINGVPLVHSPGLAPAWFQVDPAGPQPTVGADGFLHIVASSASTRTLRTLDLACPTNQVTSDPAEGASLAGVSSLNLSWSPLVQNAAAVLSFFDGPTASLYSYDVATDQTTGGIAFQFLDQTMTSTSLPVTPSGSTGYLAKFRYPGQYLLDGNTGGVCGREARLYYSAQ
jgi:hypothetical protein